MLEPRVSDISACAITMALLANGKVKDDMYSTAVAGDELVRLYPWLETCRVECPWCVHWTRSLWEAEVVYHPFDFHVMSGAGDGYKEITIEQLADWIRTIEPKETPEPSQHEIRITEVPESAVNLKG